MPGANPNFDELLSTTLANYQDKFTDNVFSRRVLAFYLKEKGRIRLVSGGTKMVMQVHLQKAPGATSYTRGDGLTYDQFALGTAAEYPWQRVRAPIAIDRLDESVNSGKEALINILEERTMLAEESLTEALNAMWFGDGTGNSGKDWLGLKALIGDHLDPITTVGGISCLGSTNGSEKWRSHVNRAGGTFSAAGNGTTTGPAKTSAGINLLRTAINTTTYGSDKVDLILSAQDIYEAFEAEQDSRVLLRDQKAIDFGFETFKYKGVNFAFDEMIPAGAAYGGASKLVYGINTKHLKLQGLSDTWFSADPFEVIQGTDIRGTNIRAYGNMGTDSRRSMFRLEFQNA